MVLQAEKELEDLVKKYPDLEITVTQKQITEISFKDKVKE